MFGTRGGELKGPTPDKISPIVRYRTCIKACGAKVPGINTLDPMLDFTEIDDLVHWLST